MTKGYSVILSTAPSDEKAGEIAGALVAERLAACVNIVPGVKSIYRWEGRIETAGELMLVIKTTSSLAPRAMERLREIHPYQVPEAVLIRIESGLGAYLDWMDRETG